MEIDETRNDLKRKVTTSDDDEVELVGEKRARFEYTNDDIRNLVISWQEMSKERQEMCKE